MSSDFFATRRQLRVKLFETQVLLAVTSNTNVELTAALRSATKSIVDAAAYIRELKQFVAVLQGIELPESTSGE